MPTNRTRRSRAPTADAITHEVCAAWTAGDFHELNRLLGVAPCDTSPFDATRARPPEWSRSETVYYRLSWDRAWQLRQALLKLAGRPGKVGRHGEPLGRARAKGHNS
jgi:hypothetical protein